MFLKYNKKSSKSEAENKMMEIESEFRDESLPEVKPVRRRKRRYKNNFFGQFIFCFICVFLVALFIYKDELKSFASGFFTANAKNQKWEISLPFSAKSQNILLMGVDVSENPERPFENTRSDSIYLVTVTPHAKNVNVISIPRDSKVYIHSRQNPDKINHAFAYGGIDASVKTIEQTLGVKIDHYIVVSNRALIEFIDAIGGVDIYIEKDMKYTDNTAKLHIDLQKGNQHLSGSEVEGYMRYRKDGLGDIGRIRRQQWFLNALAAKLKDPSVIIKIPEAIKSVSKYMQTDLSFYELAQYASLVKSTDLSNVKVAMLPGEPSQRGNVAYWILDPVGVQALVNKFVYEQTQEALDRPLEAGILYTANNEERAKNLSSELEAKGITVNLREIRYQSHDHIAIHNYDVSQETLDDLKNTIDEFKNKQIEYDAIGINKAAKDITIILAGS